MSFSIIRTKALHPPPNQTSNQDIYNEASDNVPFFTPAQKPAAGTAVQPQPSDDTKKVPKLFTPLTIRSTTFQNRIFVSPIDGPGLTMVEATAVQARGRITPEDSGIYLDAHIDALRPCVDFAHSQGQKIGIQLSHAGRKASTVAPWLSMGATATETVGGWPDDVLAPSDLRYNDAFPPVRAMTVAEIEQLKKYWVDATRRAVVAGFDVVEIHAAHGYLLHSFLSPASNKRTDQYGGSFDNRVRLLVEVVERVRGEMPQQMPLFVRISATDWLEEVEGYGPEEDKSWTAEQSARLAQVLATKGGPGYQAGFARKIKEAVTLGDKLLVSTVGSITSGKLAEQLLTGNGGDDGKQEVELDVVMAGRAFQKNPGLVWAWADELGIPIHHANQVGWGFGGRGAKGRASEKKNAP
ncbi:FMN-linked oxidoreductase [Rhypophila decipiens]|uniref:FMN-linked oxidoreductase n=1 Tax=Rhypophila decipiens TaxID=261697 RepID=A0AAN7B091_9PEZI|nr:FMN-linked oxidoreductase [Rhypophila decipiens]